MAQGPWRKKATNLGPRKRNGGSLKPERGTRTRRHPILAKERGTGVRWRHMKRRMGVKGKNM